LNTAISKQGLETETNTVRDHITRRHLPNLRDLTLRFAKTPLATDTRSRVSIAAAYTKAR